MPVDAAILTIGFPRESGLSAGTILTSGTGPEADRCRFADTELGIGAGVFTNDDEYAAAGARLAGPDEASSGPLVLRYKSPDFRDLRRLHPGQHVGALFHAEGDPDLLATLADSGVTAWSHGFVAEDGRFPLGRPGARIAGVQAVLAGAGALQAPGGRGVMPGMAGGAEPASVMIIGSGNVGGAAAKAAAALGTRVTVLARCESPAPPTATGHRPGCQAEEVPAISVVWSRSPTTAAPGELPEVLPRRRGFGAVASAAAGRRPPSWHRLP